MFNIPSYKIPIALNFLKHNPIKKNGEFARRIKQRHDLFWNSSDIETVKKAVMAESDPIEKWRDIKHWQRKLSNKINSKEFAKKYNCKVPKLYWKGRNINTINFDDLPEQFVIKPSIGHSCNWVFLMDKGFNLMDKKNYSNEQIIKMLSKVLNENSLLEFIIEEFVRTEDSEYKIPNDYKFYTFNGEIAFIQLINRLSPHSGYANFYDTNWNLLPKLHFQYNNGVSQPPPKNLCEMIKKVRELSKAYEIFVRIDFYSTDKGPVFGEFTPTPSMGCHFSSLANDMFVEHWDKFCDGEI